MSLNKPLDPETTLKVMVYEADETYRHEKLGEIIIEPNPESQERAHLNRQGYLVGYYAEIPKYAKINGFQLARPARDLVVEAFKALGFVK